MTQDLPMFGYKAALLTISNEIHRLIDENLRLQSLLSKQRSHTNRPKLTAGDVRRIREMHRNGCTQRDIAKSMDVNPATISRIVRGQYHKGT